MEYKNEKRCNFINPYNFVPLGKKCSRGEYKKGKLSGVIEYSMLTKTPLFVPDTDPANIEIQKVKVDKEQKEHKAYKFFTYDGEKPVIPGSEMRGMLRNYYEILTNSCLSAVDTDATLSKRTAQVFKGGILEYRNGHLFLNEGLVQKIKTEPSNYREGQKKGDGYVIIGEKGPEIRGKGNPKSGIHVIKVKYDGKVIKLDEAKSISRLRTAISEYQRENKDAYKQYSEELEKFIKAKKGCFPVYYSELTKDNVLLSPACITREIYNTKISDMIGDYAPCTDKKELCPTCRLFGMLNATTTITSRLRVADMKHVDASDGIYDSAWTLKPLSTPRLQNIEFYMKKPAENAWFWTYDYYIDDKGVIHNIDEFTPEINGRKFYWHHPIVDKKMVTTVNKDDKNITITPLKEGNVFTGKIFFDELTEDELNSLVYLLNTGENEKLSDKTHGYKLGHAKPFGFGSVVLSVNSVNIRTTENVNGSVKRTTLDLTKNYRGENTIVNNSELVDFERITDIHVLSKKTENARISYPIINGSDDKGFEWFVKNHRTFNRKKGEYTGLVNSRTQMSYYEYMKPMETKLVMVDEKMDEKIKNSANSYQGKPGGNRNNNNNNNNRGGNSGSFNKLKSSNSGGNNKQRPSNNGGYKGNKW